MGPCGVARDSADLSHARDPCATPLGLSLILPYPTLTHTVLRYIARQLYRTLPYRTTPFFPSFSQASRLRWTRVHAARQGNYAILLTFIKQEYSWDLAERRMWMREGGAVGVTLAGRNS